MWPLAARYRKSRPDLIAVDHTGEKLVIPCEHYDHRPYFYATTAPMEEPELYEAEYTAKYHPIYRRPVQLVKIIVESPSLVPRLRERCSTHYESDVPYTHCLGMDYCVWCAPARYDPPLYPNAPKTKDPMEYVETLTSLPLPPRKAVAYDIEVLGPGHAIPSATNPVYPVVAIAIANEVECRIHALAREEGVWDLGNDLGRRLKLICYTDEKKLLASALQEIASHPLTLGYNTLNFDNPYLFARCKRLGIDCKIQTDGMWDDCCHIDLIKVFSNNMFEEYAFKRAYRSHSLDDVASALLGASKIGSADEIAAMSLEQLARYCARDAILTYDLGYKAGALETLFMLSRLTRIPPEEVPSCSMMQLVHGFLMAWHRAKDWLIPRKDELGEARKERYVGAIVLPPKPGVHWPVYGVDFASLYPSVIGVFNISYETVKPLPAGQANIELYKEALELYQAVGDQIGKSLEEVLDPRCLESIIDKSTKGIVSELLDAARRYRIKIKKSNPVAAGALKLLLNASYGSLGNEHSRFYNVYAAAWVTQAARLCYMRALKMAKELGLEIIYGDTDSLYVKVKQGDEQKLERLCHMFEEKYGLILDSEGPYIMVIGNIKKTYMLIDPKEGKVKIKGSIAVKSDTPEWIKEVANGILSILSQVRSVEDIAKVRGEIEEYLKSEVLKLETGKVPLEKLCFTTSLRKHPAQYAANQPHIKIAKMLLAKGYDIRAGSIIRWVATDLGPEPYFPEWGITPKGKPDIKVYKERLRTLVEQLLTPLDITFPNSARQMKLF